MEKLLTVIVPVYNMENYLRQCLDSLTLPEFEESLEVLVILDGSTDHSGEIAGEYERKHPGIFRVIEKRNGGHGSAINAGARLASGKYLKVIDSDDWVDQKAFSSFIRFLARTDADVVWTNFYWIYEKEHRREIQKREPFQGVVYEKEYSFTDVADRLFMKMHSMTVKTEVLRKTGKQLDEHCYYVDVEYALYPIPWIRTIVFLDAFVYMYRLGRPGQSMTLKRMRKNRRNHERVLFSLLAFYEEQKKRGIPRPYLAYLERETARVLCSHVKIYLSFPCSRKVCGALKKMDRSVGRDYPEIYRSVRSPSVWGLRLSGYLLYYPGHFFLSLREKKHEL